MLTKIRFCVFLLLTINSAAVFAEETNKALTNTPQGTAQTNSDQHGTGGVAAGATDKETVALADIVPTQSRVIKAEEKKGEKNPEGNKSEYKPNNSSNQKSTILNHASIKEAKEIFFADNDQVKVVLSNRDINRILVIGDKIKTIHAPTGLYTAKNEPSDPSGSAYISIYGDATFTIFVVTVKGHNLSLLVTPKTVPGKTVILEPTTQALVTSNPVEADSYQKTIIDLITGMINLEPREDYEYFSISEAKKHKWLKDIKKVNFYNVAEIIPIAFYRGEKLSGIMSKVRNKTKNPLTLKASSFQLPGVRAIALSEQTIPPLGACWLYQIIGQD